MFLFIFLAVAGIVNAVPPVQTTTTTSGNVGLTIEYITDDIIQKDEAFEYHFYVYNNTNGVLISNITNGINCRGHMYNKQGMNVISLDAEPFRDGWYFNVSAGNFTGLGLFSYHVHCNDSTMGGFVSGAITVTESGEEITESNASIYSSMFIVTILLFILCVFITFKIDSKDEIDFGGILRVNFNKYIKYGMFFVSYLMLWVSTYFGWQIAYHFLLTGFIADFMRLIYITLTGLLIPIFIGGFLFMLTKWLTDLKLHKIAERGLKPR